MKQLFRTKLITGIIIVSLMLYALIRLLTLQGEIASVNEELREARRIVAELELDIAKLKHDIENYDQPDVKAGIAQSILGFVSPGEVLFNDGFNEPLDDD